MPSSKVEIKPERNGEYSVHYGGARIGAISAHPNAALVLDQKDEMRKNLSLDTGKHVTTINGKKVEVAVKELKGRFAPVGPQNVVRLPGGLTDNRKNEIAEANNERVMKELMSRVEISEA